MDNFSFLKPRCPALGAKDHFKLDFKSFLMLQKITFYYVTLRFNVEVIVRTVAMRDIRQFFAVGVVQLTFFRTSASGYCDVTLHVEKTLGDLKRSVLFTVVKLLIIHIEV